jgi:hypothetical protein
MRKSENRAIFFRSIINFSVVTFITGCVLYTLLRIIPENFWMRLLEPLLSHIPPPIGFLLSGFANPYGAIYRMNLYHWQHPYAFWLVLSISFALVAATWVRFFSARERKWRILTSIMTIPIAVFIASIPGAMLWAYYDMQAGHFQGWPGSLQYMLNWVPTGIAVGQILMFNSTPFNLVTGILAVVLLNKWGTHIASFRLVEKVNR